MAEIVWAEPAVSDLDGIADYIALDNPEAASGLVRRVFSRVGALAMHPDLGPPIPELLPSRRHRQLVESPCRIFYRHDERSKRLYILGVMRGEKLFQRWLLRKRDKSRVA